MGTFLLKVLAATASAATGVAVACGVPIPPHMVTGITLLVVSLAWAECIPIVNRQKRMEKEDRNP